MKRLSKEKQTAVKALLQTSSNQEAVRLVLDQRLSKLSDGVTNYSVQKKMREEIKKEF